MSAREATPRGKIGRMSDALREQINRMLRDNRPADEIIAFCDANGFPGISPQNVSNWKAHGFAKWLRRQERLDGMSERREFAMELAQQAREGGIDGIGMASDAASAMMVDQIAEALEEFDPKDLKDLIKDKPAHFFDLVNALSKLRQRDQAGAALAAKLREMQRLQNELEQAAKKGGGDMVAIAEEMKRVLGA